MAAPAKAAPKPAAKKELGYQVAGVFEISGGSLKRKSQSCPKCGPGFFMGNHKNRNACGKCGYTEMKKKE